MPKFKWGFAGLKLNEHEALLQPKKLTPKLLKLLGEEDKFMDFNFVRQISIRFARWKSLAVFAYCFNKVKYSISKFKPKKAEGIRKDVEKL